jgi:NitT/TauT family transport system substrate-binding protein
VKRRNALATLAAGTVQSVLPMKVQSADALHVAAPPIDAAFEVNYAQANGFTTLADINVDVQTLSSGPAVMAAVLGGAVDIGNNDVFSILAAHEKGLPIVLLAPGAIYNAKAPSSFLMVLKDSPIKSARDLNGKTIAVNALQNITQYAPMAWVDKNGGDSRNLRFVEMPFPNMPLALAAHRVDAAVIAEPFATRAIEARVLVSAYDGIASSFLIAGWVATRNWVSTHPELAKAFARLMYRTAAWANINRDITSQTLVRLTGADPALVKILPRATFAEHFDPALIQVIADTALKYGAITKPIRIEDVIAPGMPRGI